MATDKDYVESRLASLLGITDHEAEELIDEIEFAVRQGVRVATLATLIRQAAEEKRKR